MRKTRTMQAISCYPVVKQGLTIVVDESLPAGRIREVIVEAGGELLYSVELVDLYKGEQLPLGKKSMAYLLTYQANDRTLTKSDVVEVREYIMQGLVQELGAELRKESLCLR